MAGVNIPAIFVDSNNREVSEVREVFKMNVNQIKNVMKVYGEQTKTAKTAGTGKTSPTQKKDEVILSPQAQEFGQVLQSIKGLPDVREAKVAELRQKISDNTYQIPAKDVAEKMISQAKADRNR
ncbi:MAG: flagellar biosynthesis anti-sigma factor FlgM [Veillonellales bacterium]